ncbi:MAG: hypothetical protein EBS42_07985 [Caulobacteraceae bacterium]|nr:hypothetical protein [Caulobacteraceae bacterium]
MSGSRLATVRAVMSARFTPISEDLLRRIAGQAVYGRGLAYQTAGRVELLSVEGARALARVHGSERYRVELDSLDGSPSGECDCPAFVGAGFCKHMVAVALTVNAALREGRTPLDRISRARQYLSTLEADRLVERLLVLAVRYPDLLDEIELDAADAAEDDAALAVRYRRAIDAVWDRLDGADWQGAGDAASEFAPLMARLEALASDGRATMVLTVLDHLFDQASEMFEAVDDSEGEISAILEQAGELHLKACEIARPDPVRLAGLLFAREMTDDWNGFQDVASAYEAVLGRDGLAEYRRLATEAWALKRSGGDGAGRLKSILDGLARRDGDLEARIALRKDDLKQPAGYLEIARLLVEADRKTEALTWLEEAIWCFEDRPDARLDLFAAELLADAGREAEAGARMWAAFRQRPCLELYNRLKVFETGREARVGEAMAILQEQLSRPRQAGFWESPAVVMLDIQMDEGPPRPMRSARCGWRGWQTPARPCIPVGRQRPMNA